jgi:hypothetical protein
VGDVASGTDPTAGGREAGGDVGDKFYPPPPTFHSVSTGALAGGFLGPIPATNGDLLVCFVGTTGGLGQTVNTGWTQVRQSSTSSAGQDLGCYIRTRTGSDPKPITGSVGNYVCYAISGWAAVDASDQGSDAGAGTALVAPSLAITANDLELFAWVCTDSLNTATFPAGLTMTKNTTSGPHVAVGRQTSFVTPTGTQTATIGAAREWATISVAIR